MISIVFPNAQYNPEQTKSSNPHSNSRQAKTPLYPFLTFFRRRHLISARPNFNSFLSKARSRKGTFWDRFVHRMTIGTWEHDGPFLNALTFDLNFSLSTPARCIRVHRFELLDRRTSAHDLAHIFTVPTEGQRRRDQADKIARSWHSSGRTSHRPSRSPPDTCYLVLSGGLMMPWEGSLLAESHYTCIDCRR